RQQVGRERSAMLTCALRAWRGRRCDGCNTYRHQNTEFSKLHTFSLARRPTSCRDVTHEALVGLQRTDRLLSRPSITLPINELSGYSDRGCLATRECRVRECDMCGVCARRRVSDIRCDIKHLKACSGFGTRLTRISARDQPRKKR